MVQIQKSTLITFKWVKWKYPNFEFKYVLKSVWNYPIYKNHICFFQHNLASWEEYAGAEDKGISTKRKWRAFSNCREHGECRIDHSDSWICHQVTYKQEAYSNYHHGTSLGLHPSTIAVKQMDITKHKKLSYLKVYCIIQLHLWVRCWKWSSH